MVGFCQNRCWISVSRPLLQGVNASSDVRSRAGLSPKHQAFRDLLEVILASSAVSVYGFYGHCGQSYGSKSPDEASQFLSTELQAVNDAAEITTSLIAQTNAVSSHNTPFVLSVGSTPTAHAATPGANPKLYSSLHGKLEIHAGAGPPVVTANPG